MNIYKRMASEDVLNTIDELTRSGMMVEFSSFESTRDVGKQVFSCKIKSYSKYDGFKEHAKGYGDNVGEAFDKAYNKLNQISYDR